MKNDTIENAIVRQAEHIRLLDAIIPVLEAERTKTITKRLATKIEQAINDSNMHVLYDPDRYGNKEIHIYGGVLKYDDGLSISFTTRWGDGWTCKTEQEATDRTIEQMHAWRKSGEASLDQLKRELSRLDEMVKAYAKIAKDYKQACDEFKKEYGTNGLYSREVSYTTRTALEEITGVKIEL